MHGWLLSPCLAARSPELAPFAGLGLTIVKSLSELLGGSVNYAPREGGGSVFSVRLPVRPAVDVACLGVGLRTGLPGAELEVMASAPFDGPITVRIGAATHPLDRRMAREILVECTATNV